MSDTQLLEEIRAQLEATHLLLKALLAIEIDRAGPEKINWIKQNNPDLPDLP